LVVLSGLRRWKMVDYGLAIKKPFANIKNFAIGVIIALIAGVAGIIIPVVGWLVGLVLWFIILGYILQSSGVGKVKADTELPEWTDWVGYLKTGILATIANIVYMIPALIVFAIGIGAALASIVPVIMAGGTPDMTALAGVLGASVSFILIGVILALVAVYMLPMALLNYVKSGTFGDAFAFSAVKKKAFTGTYFVAWLLGGILTMVIVVIINLVLFFLPFLNAALAAIIGLTVYYSIMGQVYKELK